MGGCRKCVICNIRESAEKKTFFATFPRDENRCRQWLKAVGVAELVHLPIEKLNQIRFICGNHFEKRDFYRKGNRLKKRAIPKLNLSAVPLTDEELVEFPQHIFQHQHDVPDLEKHVHKEHDYAKHITKDDRNEIEMTSLNLVPDKTFEPAPGCSKTLNIPNQEIQVHIEHDYAKYITNSPVSDKTFEPTPGCSKSFGIPNQEKQVHIEHDYAKYITNSPVSHKTFEPTPGCSKSFDFTPKKQKMAADEKKSLCARTKTKTDDANIELTPRKKKLIEKLRKTQCTLKSLRKSSLLVESIDSPVLKGFVTAAFRNQKRKPQGRRWSTMNKISALAIFKRSPKAYRYLQYIMPLPTPKTLHNVLRKIPIEPGINISVIDHLKKISHEKSNKDKLCGLLFDEIALKPRVVYNMATDQVDGYHDFGNNKNDDNGRRDEISDHALVFMLQGIHVKFKQPLAFYFVKGTVSSEKLATIIKDIIREVSHTGFEIITTICDQGPTNVGAMTLLKKISSPDFSCENLFLVDNKKVFIIYDVPHLFKSIRNNFFNHGVLQMENRKAFWSHIFKVEEKNRAMLYLSKITQNHVRPKYRAKMRVKYAAQILSNTVAAVLKLLSQAEQDPNESKALMETAFIIQELDKLFDFTNGPSSKDDIKKGLRENVSSKTQHVIVWSEFRKKLESTKFFNTSGIQAKNVRCIQGFLITLRSLHDIWMKVSELGFKYLNLRQLNQDALENLFGLIRQHSPTNKNPTCTTFMAALKTSVLSGMTAPHSKSSNCEKDYKKLLTNFHELVFKKKKSEEIDKENITSNVTVLEMDAVEPPVLSLPEDYEFNEIENDLTNIDAQPLVYVSGYIASTIVKNNNCSKCKENIIDKSPELNPIYAYIKLREWWNGRTSLTYPTEKFCRTIEDAVKAFEENLIPIMYKKCICQLCVTFFITKCDISWFTCKKHAKGVFDAIFVRLGRLLIRRQCQRINQGLALKEEDLADAAKKSQQQGIAK